MVLDDPGRFEEFFPELGLSIVLRLKCLFLVEKRLFRRCCGGEATLAHVDPRRRRAVLHRVPHPAALSVALWD